MKNQLLNLKMIALMCLMMVLGGAKVWAQETVTIWSEDWTGQKADATPSSINSMYSQGKADTKLYTDKMYAGGVAPELLLASKDKWTIKISDLKGCSGELTLSFHTNRNPQDRYPISVTANGNSIKLSVDESDNKLCTGTFSVEEGTSNVTIVFNGNTSKNARIDDVVLTGIKAQTKKLTSLAISGTPTKTTYEVGEAFDPTGLVVTGTYDDNTTAPITNGITWAMNPATLSLSDVSCSVTATIGGITSPAYNVTGLTVNEAKLPSTTDATFGPDWDKLFGTSYNGQIRSLKANKLELNGVSNGVKIKVTNGTSTNGYVKTNDFRLYGKYTITITAPKDVLLSEITMTSQTQNKDLKIEENKITSNVGSVKLDGEDLKWIGSSNEIQFKFSDKVSLSTIKVATKAATAEPTYTAQTLTLKATDGSYNYSTFSSDKVTFFPGDGGVFPLAVTVKGNIIEQDYNVFKEETVTIDTKAVKGLYVPANTGVMLMSDFADVTYYTVDNYTVAALTADANMLKPAPATTSVFTAETGYKYYKLAYDNYDARTGLGFYWGAENGGAFKVKAGTAYLAVPAGEATAKGFTLSGEATGIEGVNANVENAKAIYNLNGQRVASMAKPGLYIVNGKKVVRK